MDKRSIRRLECFEKEDRVGKKTRLRCTDVKQAHTLYRREGTRARA